MEEILSLGEIRYNKFKNKTVKEVFTTIYNECDWQSDPEVDSVSGRGSMLEYTKNIREQLPRVVKFENIKSLLDFGCGDLNWIKEMLPLFDRYTGVDIVDDLIQQNIDKYSNDKIKFKVANILTFDFSKYRYDAILLKDVLVHLKNSHIKKVLFKIKKSRIKYIIATNFTSINYNDDLSSVGLWRPINLSIKPFYIGEPIKIIEEQNETYNWNNELKTDKTLTIWKIK